MFGGAIEQFGAVLNGHDHLCRAGLLGAAAGKRHGMRHRVVARLQVMVHRIGGSAGHAVAEVPNVLYAGNVSDHRSERDLQVIVGVREFRRGPQHLYVVENGHAGRIRKTKQAEQQVVPCRVCSGVLDDGLVPAKLRQVVGDLYVRWGRRHAARVLYTTSLEAGGLGINSRRAKKGPVQLAGLDAQKRTMTHSPSSMGSQRGKATPSRLLRWFQPPLNKPSIRVPSGASTF